MPSKKLMGFWAFFDFCLLAAGVIAIVFSVVWQGPNPIRHLVVTSMDMTAGLALGIMLLITFVISIGAIVQPNHVTRPLAILNWTLILDTLATVVIGTMIWWATLQERNNFSMAFDQATPDVRQAVQDKFQCCGYWFNNETSINTTQGFCGSASVVANATACVGPLTGYADTTLNDIFTSIYGFAAVIIGLFLATLCVIKKRYEGERFRKIDAKRGGRGFV